MDNDLDDIGDYSREVYYRFGDRPVPSVSPRHWGCKLLIADENIVKCTSTSVTAYHRYRRT
jgi:hypothetical protein